MESKVKAIEAGLKLKSKREDFIIHTPPPQKLISRHQEAKPLDLVTSKALEIGEMLDNFTLDGCRQHSTYFL